MGLIGSGIYGYAEEGFPSLRSGANLLDKELRRRLSRSRREAEAASDERHPTDAKIQGQTLVAKEVQPEESIDTCTRWQGVAQDWKT